jgi:Arc/MetJ-type ribon-helix-helix transcriptional regulator
MKTISVNLPEAFVKGLEDLVQRGLYANRSEAIRVAVRDLIKRELIESIAYNGIREKNEENPAGKVEESSLFLTPTPSLHFLFDFVSSIPVSGPWNLSQFEPYHSLFSFFEEDLA